MLMHVLATKFKLLIFIDSIFELKMLIFAF